MEIARFDDGLLEAIEDGVVDRQIAEALKIVEQ